MEIYILSSGRASRQPTWDSLSGYYQQQTVLVVPRKEAKAYAKYPCIYDPGIPLVGAVRRWICEQARGNFLMLDDDLTFAIRRVDDPTKFHNASEDDIARAITTIDNFLRQGEALVGIAMREGANRNTHVLIENVRMARVYGYNLDIVKKCGIIWDRCQSMDDFDVALQLMRKGHKNIALNWIVQNQYGSNALGGASQWRDQEVQSQAAFLLHRYHPDYVKIVRKKTTAAWSGFPDGERDDVIVQWKKAYEDGIDGNKPT